MKNEIIIGTVAAVLASALTYFAGSAKESLNRVQIQELATIISNKEAFTKVLIDDLSKDRRFMPKDGKDGVNGQDGTSKVVPTGAVLSFNLLNCPNGWKAYTKAYGRFIRGLDITGDIDPGRRLGTTQSDEIVSHRHKWGGTSNAVGGNTSSLSKVGNQTQSPTSNFGGNETRPKNVALLYCEKKQN